MTDMVAYEYYSSKDNPFLPNPKRNQTVDRINRVLNNMFIDENSVNTVSADLSHDEEINPIYSASNNYRLDVSVIDRDIPQSRFDKNRSRAGLKAYKVIDKNDPTKYKRYVDARGFVNPVNDWQTSYVAVPLVYCGKDANRSLDPFEYNNDDNMRDYAPLYPPQWDIVRRNYPEFRTIVDSMIADRFSKYVYKKMFYSDANSCWLRCDTSRIRELVEHITDLFYKDYVVKPLEEAKKKKK